MTNGPLAIDPSDLDGSFDLLVNAGMGAGAKQTNLQNLQLVRELSTQLAEVGLSGPQQWYNLAKRIIEEVGFKNVDDFLIDPSQMAAQMPQQGEQDSGAEDNKTTIRSAITDAPWQVQMQFWQKLGFEVTPDMFTEQAAQKVLSGAADAQAKADAGRGGRWNGAGIGTQPPDRGGQGSGGRLGVSSPDAQAQAGAGFGAAQQAQQYGAGAQAGGGAPGVSSY